MYYLELDEMVKEYLLSQKEDAPKDSVLKKANNPNDLQISIVMPFHEPNNPCTTIIHYEVV